MPLTIIGEPQYKITNQPDLEELTFTCSSKENLNWPQAVKFCADKKSILQSLREAVGFRAEANGTDEANEYQVTRTVAVYFNQNGKRYVAFDDIADPKQNIILARAQEGYDAFLNNTVWHLPMKDEHVKQTITRAKKDKRVIEVPKEQEWRVKDYVTQPIVKVSIGDMAEPNAQFLIIKSYKKGIVWTPTQTSTDKADVRVVGLGGDDFNKLNYVGNCFYRRLRNAGGRARGTFGTPEALRWKP